MSAKVCRSILMFGLVLWSARPCVAQMKPVPETPAVATLDRLPDVAPQGTKVAVTDSRGKTIVGKIRSITADSVSLTGNWDGKTYEMKREEIQTIRKPGDSSAGGAIAGALAGLGGAVLLIYVLPDDENHAWVFALIPIGGVAGYFGDRAVQDRRLLYAKPSGTRVSFQRALGENFGVRADVGLVTPWNRRPAPRVAASLVISFGSHRRR